MVATRCTALFCTPQRHLITWSIPGLTYTHIWFSTQVANSCELYVELHDVTKPRNCIWQNVELTAEKRSLIKLFTTVQILSY